MGKEGRKLKEAVEVYSQTYSKYLFCIDDTSGPTLKRIIEVCNINHPRIVFVDYIQNVVGPGKSEYEAVTGAMEAFEQFSKELKAPFVVASQLHRRMNVHDDNYEPNLADLRGSGRIEEIASGIVLMWHGGDRTMLKIAKNRSFGTLGTFSLSCIPETGVMLEQDYAESQVQ